MDSSIQDAAMPEWDHRRIGKEQDLFSFVEQGPGLPFFHPKGLALKNLLMAYWRKLHEQYDYAEIQSPMLLDQSLWQQSGHWQHFRENMYVSKIEDRVFAIKPMNCPGAILYFQQKRRSHAELPLRVCELGQVHRHEPSGSLRGLLRVREFIVDDGHIFCAQNQAQDEIRMVLQMAIAIMQACGFDKYVFELSLRSEEKSAKYLGSDQQWQAAEEVLCQAAQSLGQSLKVMPGEAKFYGPAIDVKIKDSVGREWQCASIQMDFNLPGRFSLRYFDEMGKPKEPVLIHRALFGSLERFMGMLLEHHQGKLPFWLSPVQVKILSIKASVEAYGNNLRQRLQGIWRCELDLRDMHISEKIKQWQKEKIPLAIILGNREAKANCVSLRHLNGEQFHSVSLEELEQKLRFWNSHSQKICS